MPEVDPVSVVYCVGRIGPTGVQLLGSAFAVGENLLATAAHVTQGDDRQLGLLIPKVKSIQDYQDTRDPSVTHTPLRIHAIDPVTDIALLKLDGKLPATVKLGTSDSVAVGEEVFVLGYPHADLARNVLTNFKAIVGAKVITGTPALGVKHLVINTQARMGQSGGPVLYKGNVVGLVVGVFSPIPSGKGIMLGNIDPYTLHQTTHVVSCEYVKEMLADG